MRQTIEHLETPHALRRRTSAGLCRHGRGVGEGPGQRCGGGRRRQFFVAGVYNGPVDFDPSAGKAVLPGTGSDDAFLAKYSPAGHLIWRG